METGDLSTLKTIIEITKSSDPITQSIIVAVIIIVAIVFSSKPLMYLVKQYKTDKISAENSEAISDANNLVYKRLQEQIDRLFSEISSLSADRNKLIDQNLHKSEEILALRARVQKLEDYEKIVESLRNRLAIKDKLIEELRATISSRDEKLIGIMRELVVAKDRLNELEMRISSGENGFKPTALHSEY